jgi:hypothetical protein
MMRCCLSPSNQQLLNKFLKFFKSLNKPSESDIKRVGVYFHFVHIYITLLFPHPGLSEGTELHQYVLYDTIPSLPQKGPKRIVLDDSNKDKGKDKGKYTPPKSLTVHLSKIPMPELQPKANPNDK